MAARLARHLDCCKGRRASDVDGQDRRQLSCSGQCPCVDVQRHANTHRQAWACTQRLYLYMCACAPPSAQPGQKLRREHARNSPKQASNLSDTPPYASKQTARGTTRATRTASEFRKKMRKTSQHSSKRSPDASKREGRTTMQTEMNAISWLRDTWLDLYELPTAKMLR